MLSTLSHAVRSSNLSFGRVLTGAAAIIMSASIVAPMIAQQQESERATRELSQSTGIHHDQLGVYDKLWRDRLEGIAQVSLTKAESTVQANAAKTDTTAAKTAIAGLDDFKKLDDSKLRAQIDTTDAATTALAAAGVAADQKAAAQAAAAAAAAAAIQANANTPSGARTAAQTIMSSSYGWGSDQFQCLNNLWTKESGWNYQASNGSSGATGIPQALPGSKMATFGSDWATNATTQIKWGLSYIKGSYGTPCSAWSHSEAMNWY